MKMLIFRGGVPCGGLGTYIYTLVMLILAKDFLGDWRGVRGGGGGGGGWSAGVGFEDRKIY